jgi:hypothetical protein
MRAVDDEPGPVKAMHDHSAWTRAAQRELAADSSSGGRDGGEDGGQGASNWATLLHVAGVLRDGHLVWKEARLGFGMLSRLVLAR